MFKWKKYIYISKKWKKIIMTSNSSMCFLSVLIDDTQNHIDIKKNIYNIKYCIVRFYCFIFLMKIVRILIFYIFKNNLSKKKNIKRMVKYFYIDYSKTHSSLYIFQFVPIKFELLFCFLIWFLWLNKEKNYPKWNFIYFS